MANKILVTEMDGTPKQITFAGAGAGFSATTNLRLSDAANRTDVVFTYASLANGAARESDKFDFGAERAVLYGIRGAMEFILSPAPTAGNTIDLYLAPSSSATAGTGNPGGVSGEADASDTNFTATGGVLEQLQFIGRLVCTADSGENKIQVMEGGTFSPTERYGTLVVVNNSGTALFTDNQQCHIVFNPIVDEVQ